MVLIGALALTGCAAADASGTDSSAMPSDSMMSDEPMKDESMTDEPMTDESMTGDADDMAAHAAGAYLDYEDGIIASTAGPKALFFHASWCPKCRALDEDLRAKGAPDDLTVFKVDYDSRTDLRQQYGVTMQTTIVFVDDAGEKISDIVLYDDPSVASLEAAIP